MKWNIVLAKEFYYENGLVLLEEEYKNCNQPMKCILQCGCIGKLRLYNVQAKKGLVCRSCGLKNRWKERKITFKEVEQYFLEQGCILLSSEYASWDSKLIYIANCGHEHRITFNKFKANNQGRLCPKCRYPKGEKHHAYNSSLTNEERIINRDYYEIKVWRDKVFERDNFECRVCGRNVGGDLNAHHLNGYNWCIEERLEIENGITLCQKCHMEFHKKFGYGNNTKEQFYEQYKIIPR